MISGISYVDRQRPIDVPPARGHTRRMRKFLAEARKALIAAVIAGGGAILAGLSPESPGGQELLIEELWAALGFAISSAGAVWAVPNRVSAKQRAKIETAVRAQVEAEQAAGPWRSRP